MIAAPIVVYRGLVDYVTCWHEMRAYTAERDASTPDQIWLVEHPPIYTLGQAAKLPSLFVQQHTDTTSTNIPTDWHNVPVLKIDRGGQITYHGPGQIIAYLLLDLKRWHLFVRELVYLAEQAVIETLAALNIQGGRHSGHPGIYLQQDPYTGAKIAALGLKISRGCSYHGIALNVAMDLQPFHWIHPCGQKNLPTVDLASLGITLNPAQVGQSLSQHLLNQLEISASRTRN